MKSVTRMTFDDRKTNIRDHIAEYERAWNTFVGVIMRLDLTSDDGFCAALQSFTKSEKAKTEFLLDSLPPFYSNTVENIKSKDGNYDDTIRKLIEYVPMRQKGRKHEGTKDEPVVLKTEGKALDKSKQCKYCQDIKGWKGIGHTKDECRTYKKEKKDKAKAKQAKAEEVDSESDEEGVTVCMVRVGKVGIRRKGWFQYDTGTSHPTTNQLKFLRNTKQINLPVEAHDGTQSICHTKGTLEIIHNGRTIKHEDAYMTPLTAT